jgi:hypothetical protein
MKARQLLVYSAVATSCMTTFSYLVSNLKKENFPGARVTCCIGNELEHKSGWLPRRPADWMAVALRIRSGLVAITVRFSYN